MKDEMLSQMVNVFVVISGVCGAIAIGNSFALLLLLEIVAGVFLIAVAAAVVAIALALFAIRKQDRRYQDDGRIEGTKKG